MVEDELIRMLKAYHKGDGCELFYSLDKKTYDINLKAMLLTTGILQEFGEPGKFNFIPNSLDDGWDLTKFPELANEIRRGTQGRSLDTAKGGEESKIVMRMLQNARIVMDDCGSKQGVQKALTSENIGHFLHRNVIINPAGDIEEIVPENMSKYIGTTVTLRSFQRCLAPHGGYCYMCGDMTAKQTGQTSLTMRALDIPSAFMQARMKGMHGTKVGVIRVTDIDQYLY
jgi:hypothetical protein